MNLTSLHTTTTSTVDLVGLPERRFTNACQILRRSVPGEIPLVQLMILVHLYDHDGSSQANMCKLLSILPAACSRHCRSLATSYVRNADTGELVKKGQGLIVSQRDPVNARQTMHSLTSEARGVVRQFIDRITGK